jgi:dTDP-4-amino-4,6-dideoxygalactose transaminase
MIPEQQVYFPPDERRRLVAEIDRILASGRLTLGRETAAFEDEFAGRVGTRCAVATASGTVALEIILRILGVAGRAVVVPANTFFATAAAVVHAGGVPVLCDVRPDTLMPDRDLVRAAWTANTVGCVLVHIGGAIAPDAGEILDFCASQGGWVVEDAAHAIGSRWQGRPAGSLGIAAAFSLYPTKVVTAAEGGVIATGDAALAAEARIYRDQGKVDFSTNTHIRMGGSWRMSEIHAAIGRSQLRCLDTFIEARRRVAAIYDSDLRGVKPIQPGPDVFQNYYKYSALLGHGIDRAAFKQELERRHGMKLASEVYERPLHRQPVFSACETRPLPGADEACARLVCLPMSATMTEADARLVSAAVAQVADRL